ncbi:TonB-dependent receptor [Compostibacter hankyongensis]|uniref:TonB-dependent receptor n=2 Tax=Compostibacter hankyongensis TaxID=1007089 RepID=A0ABP8FRY6_9BACT
MITASAQVTTSAINGRVTGGDGSGLPGATVVAVHGPTGTRYGTVTDASGFYNLPNMNVGGPYTLNVTFLGYNEYKEEGINLTLGQTSRFNVKLTEKSATLGEVEVRADRNNLFDGNHTGVSTTLSRQQLEALPTVGRNYTDFVRMTPQAQITKDGGGNPGVSIAGMNSRYNAITVDGAIQNDVFGLAGNGANGGQIGISPFGMDIIDQITINVTPYDVKQGGFAGGAIDAVTRSGTNDFQGSAYYLFRNEDLAGKKPTDNPDEKPEKFAPFSSKTYGLRLGGPIVKDKLFFFANVEIDRRETPQPFTYTTYADGKGADAASQDDLAQLIAKLKGYGYDPGGYESNTESLDGTKLFARIDWNISDKHKFTIRHQYTHGNSISPANSSASSIAFANEGIAFPSTTNATTAELKSLFNNKVSNDLLVGVNIVRDDRKPMGKEFPHVGIQKEGVYFGSEEFSTANLLKQDVITLTDNVQLYQGKHTITLGTHNEYYNMYNVFIRQNYGSYTFANLDDFLNDRPATAYNRTFSALDNKTGDNTKAAAEFKALQLGLYAQDDYQLSERFKLTFGLRADMPIMLDQPAENKDFNENVLPKLKLPDGKAVNARTGEAFKAVPLLSPRISFNWDADGDKTTQLRGGVGIFTSRIPYVWLGSPYNTNGVTLGGISWQNTDNNGDPIQFIPDWQQQPTVTAAPSGEVDMLDRDFKLPQVLKASLAVDRKLPWGIVGTLEGIYTKNLNNVLYYNLRYNPSGKTLTGESGDHRTIWQDVGTGVLQHYTDIMYVTNTNKGYAYNISLQLQKSFDNGFFASVGYTYGSSKSMNDGQSSQNSSQWRVPNINGKNDVNLSYSIYNLGSRVVAAVSYRKAYAKHFATTLSLFYNGQSGAPFSYGYYNAAKNQSVTMDGDYGTSLNIMYIPKDRNDINLVPYTDNNGTVHSVDEQWEALNKFIEKNKYLSDRRGQYAEKFAARTPFTSILDLHFAQEFFMDQQNGKRHTLEVTFDVFNLGNLINKKWGRIYTNYAGMSYGNYGLVDFAGFEADGTTPTFNYKDTPAKSQYKTVANIDDIGLQSSRWQGQIGLRYTFE